MRTKLSKLEFDLVLKVVSDLERYDDLNPNVGFGPTLDCFINEALWSVNLTVSSELKEELSSAYHKMKYPSQTPFISLEGLDLSFEDSYMDDDLDDDLLYWDGTNQ